MSGQVQSLAYNHDGTQLAAGLNNGNVWIYNRPGQNACLYPIETMSGQVNSLDYNHDGTQLAVGGDDRKVRIYDAAASYALLYTLTDTGNPILTVAYNHNGTRLAAGTNDGKLLIYNLDDENSRGTQEPSTQTATPAVTFDEMCNPSVSPGSREDFRDQLDCIKGKKSEIHKQISRYRARILEINTALGLRNEISTATPQVPVTLIEDYTPDGPTESLPGLRMEKQSIKPKIIAGPIRSV